MGHHATQEAAARIHDRAVIALHGRKVRAGCSAGTQDGLQQRHGRRVCLPCPPHPPYSFPYPRLALQCCLVVLQGAAASGLLNFGVEQYPGEQQRYGPDLNAFLLNLW